MAIAAVRAAATSDVDEIVRIQAETWEVAYAQLVPPAAIERLRSDEARKAWVAALEAPDGHVLVATEGTWTVGFVAASVGGGPSAERGPQAWGEIGALLVEPRWGRRGHGGRLLAAAAEELRGGGAIYGLAWVPETDEVSRRFYARAGWEADGAARAFDTGDGTLREIRMTGSLDLKMT